MLCGEDDFGCRDNLNNLGIIFEIESRADVNNSYTESCVDNSSTGGEIRGTIVSAGVLRGPPQDDAPIGDTDLGSDFSERMRRQWLSKGVVKMIFGGDV